jgi:hypothetical protein
MFPMTDVRRPSRGLSSAGRAPALQAGGHRFDPDSLHQAGFYDMQRSVSVRTFLSAPDSVGRLARPFCASSQDLACKSADLAQGDVTALVFFITVNQVLVRLWMRRSRSV